MSMSKFVIVYNDNTVRSVPESAISRMYDLADCDAMDGVRDVYAVDESGKLVPVEIGKQKRFDYWDGIYFASSEIKAGKRVVGFVHYSDH